MATPGGTITRQDLITDDALNWGPEHQKQIEKVIGTYKELAGIALELSKVPNSFRKADNQQEFLAAKQQQILLEKEAISIIKQREASEISADKIKKSSISLLETERKAKQASTDAELKAQKAKQASVKLTIEERIQNEINNKTLKGEAMERLGLVSAYTKLSAERTKAKIALKELILSETASTSEVKKAQKEFDTLDSKIKKADKAVGDFTKNVGNYPLKNFASGVSNLAGAFGILGGAALAAGILKDAYEKIKQFEQGVADLSAITGATGKDLEYLKTQAIELGKSTKGGAIAVVEAYKLIASAKPELLDDVKALNMVTEATLTLAKASGMDMPAAATALTDAMNQFGADASKSQVFIDALANGAKYGSAEIPQLTEALLKFGAVSRSTNVSIQESTALVELLAENGLKGADAGTALRNVMLKISAPDALPRKAQEALHSLGIDFATLKDKSVSFQEKIELLKPLLSDNAKLVKVFGLENIVAAQNVIEHSDRLKDLTSKMGEYGTAQEQADIRTNTLQGDTDKMTSAYDSLILSLANGSGTVSGFFRFFVQGATDALNGLMRLNTSWDDLFKKAKEEGAASGVKLYNDRFNSMIGDKLSDEQRQKIRDRIKEINDEIAKGSKDKNLQGEKTDLFRMLGTGDDLEVSLSIAKQAYIQAKIYESKIADINKKIKKDSSFGAIGSDGETRLTTLGLKEDKERLIKGLAEQNAIILENNKKVQASRIKVDPKDGTAPGVDSTDAENKKAESERKKHLKEIYDANKKAADDEFKLSQYRKQVAIDFENDIINSEKESIDDRITAYDLMHKTMADKNQEAAVYELKQLGKYNDETGVFIRQLSDVQISQIIKTGKTTQKLSSEQQLIYEKYKNDEVAIFKKAEADKQKIIDSEVDRVQKEIDAKKQLSDKFMNESITLENNRYAQELEALQNSHGDLEKAEKDHQKRLQDIKRGAEKDDLQLIINGLQLELDKNAKEDVSCQISADKRKNIEADLAKARADFSALGVDDKKTAIDKEVDIEIKYAEKVKQLRENLTSAVQEFGNAIFEAKIANIDNEIKASDDYYAGEIEKAGNDQRKKDILSKEAEKKRQELEKKKREEQHKQAVVNKLFAIAQIGINTAMAISKTIAEFGLPLGTPFVIADAVLGALQLATVIATPIPKYKDGRKGGKAEIAMINDGGVTEVVSNLDGGNPRTTPKKNAIVQLLEGDIVHKNVDDYNRYIRASILSSVTINNDKMNSYQAQMAFNLSNDTLVLEIKEVKNAIKNQKQNIIFNAPKMDFNYEMWKSNIKSWKA